MRVMSKTLRMGAIWLLLAVCFWAAGTACLMQATPDAATVRVSMRYLPQNEPPFDGIQKWLDEAEIRRQDTAEGTLTAWAESRNESISAPEWNANASIDVYYVDGSTQDVMDLHLSAGGFPDREDKMGIALDVDTAVKLFGSTAPIGLKVEHNGKEMLVRGVFEKPVKLPAWGSDTGRGIAIVSASAIPAEEGGPSIGVQGAELTLPAGLSPEEAKQAAQQLASTMGLGGAAATWEHSGSGILLRQAAQVPGWMMMAAAVWMLLRAAASAVAMMTRLAWRRAKDRTTSARVARNTLLRGLLTGFLLLVLAAGIIVLVRPAFHLPPAYIPTKWSDTAFWPGLIKTALLEKAEQSVLPVSRPDAMRNALKNWGMLFTVASAVCVVLLNARTASVLGRPVYKRLKKHPDGWSRPAARWDMACSLMMVIAALAPPLGLMFAGTLGLSPSLSGRLWGMQVLPVAVLTVEFLLRLWPSALWPLRFSAKGWMRTLFPKKGTSRPDPPKGGKRRGIKLRWGKKAKVQTEESPVSIKEDRPKRLKQWPVLRPQSPNKRVEALVPNSAQTKQKVVLPAIKLVVAPKKASMPPARPRRGA